MSWRTDKLLAAIRRLPPDARQQLIERAERELYEDTVSPPQVGSLTTPSLLGLMADAPELVDEMYSLVYRARSAARMRPLDG